MEHENLSGAEYVARVNFQERVCPGTATGDKGNVKGRINVERDNSNQSITLEMKFYYYSCHFYY